MDLNLEIISEESDCPDPLFESIMDAMNSMKDATADKIYQKIQKDGVNSYSKPQVGRALANALKYGIFEIRNNRYRVRDDILDDEDTVYWKLQKKKREQTPFRIQDDINDRQFGPKLDPERDNKRFKAAENEEGLNKRTNKQCPHCGRAKRMSKIAKNSTEKNQKRLKKRKKMINKKNTRVQFNAVGRSSKKKGQAKGIKQSNHGERNIKKRKTNGKKIKDKLKEKLVDSENRQQEEAYYSTDSEMDAPPNNQSSNQYSGGSMNKCSNEDNQSQSLSSLDEIKGQRTSNSLKFDSESDQMDVSSVLYDRSRTEDSYFESLPCTSRHNSSKTRNQFISSTGMYSNECSRSETDQCQEKSDWPVCSGEPQGAIILSNNVLTIEPMDSLAFKNQEQASYIS